jgi:broad specificity phosphatase PhoE
MVTILWARHGQNAANLTRTFSYRVYDGDLTDAGLQQARQLADHLVVTGGGQIGQLICSPLRRPPRSSPGGSGCPWPASWRTCEN